MPKITAIVPCFNEEEALQLFYEEFHRVAVTMPQVEFELLFVNDGSTDNSLKILNEYALKDSRITIINQENSGVSTARNNALKMCTSDYVVFLDSDDWLEPSYIEELFHVAEATKAQLVVSGFTMEYFESGERKSYCVSVSDEVFYNRETVRGNLQNYYR